MANRRLRDYCDLEERLENFQKVSGRTEIFPIGEVRSKEDGKEYRMYRLDFNKTSKRVNICFSAGAHGEEMDGVNILLGFLEKHRNDKEILRKFGFVTFPVINPIAYEFRDYYKRNINRYFGRTDKKMEEVKNVERALANESVDLFVDIHGDDEEHRFYCYERRFDKRFSIGRGIIDEVGRYYPINEERRIYREVNVNGVVFAENEEYTFEKFMFEKGAKFSLTIEFPIELPREDRIGCGMLALEAALKTYKN